MLFWIIAAAIALAVLVTLAAALRRPAAAAPTSPDMAIYRDQLAEIDRDLARGALAADEAARVRAEIGRRILTADRAAPARTGIASGRSERIALAALALVLGLGGLGLYAWLGAPGYGDLPRAERIARSEEFRQTRPRQAEVEAELALTPRPAPDLDADYAQMIGRLREVMAERPDDLQGWTLLAQHEAQLGEYAAAARAQEQVIRLKGPETTAADLLALADRLIAATDGYVSPEAEAALEAVLTLDPANSGAQYYTGLMYAQIDRPDIAFALWRPIVEGGQPSAYANMARGLIEQAAFAAGVDYSLPAGPAPRGPGAEDVAAMAALSPEEREANIAGMVATLAGRLASQGGSAEEWAQLIRALGVQGDTDRARAIWAEAQQIHEGADLALIRAAAEAAGVAE